MRRRVGRAPGVLTVVLSVPLAVTIGTSGAGRASAAPDVPRVLVVPFENVDRDPRASWLGEASAVLLSEALTARGAAAIGRSERVRALGQLGLPATSPLSHATIIRIGQILGASEVVVGSIQIHADELTVRARRIDLDSGARDPDLVEIAPLRDLFGLHERLGRRFMPAGTGVASAAGLTPRLETFENYIKGLLAESPAIRMRHLEQALLLQPGYAPARLALWEVHHEMGSHARALAAARAVTADGPYLRQARFYGAISLLEMDQHQEAFAAFRSLVEDSPAAAVYNNLGVLQLRRGWTPETGRPSFYLQRAVDLAPDDPDFCFNLGYALWLEQDVRSAAYWLREAVRRQPADGDVHFVLAAALQATGATAEADRERELADQLSSRYAAWEQPPGSGGVPDGLERVRYELEPVLGLTMAAAVAGSIQREQEDLAAFHLERGVARFLQERDGDALAELRRALFLAPYLAEAHLWVGRIHLRTGRTSDAVDAFRIALWSEETAAAHAALGEALFQAGDAPAAREHAVRALDLDPDCPEAQRLLERSEPPPGR